MILHPPETHTANGEITLSARVETRPNSLNLPETLWFTFPEEYAPHLTGRIDPFAVAMYQLAMYLGEDLEVRGALSPRLMYGLEEAARIFHLWKPRHFKQVAVRTEGFAPAESSEGLAVAAFSGGLDSFYTLRTSRLESGAIPGMAISHGLFIHGMDIRLARQDYYAPLFARYAALFQELGLTLLTARTNVRDFLGGDADWEFTHGSALIATAHCFAPLFGKFYVPSSRPIDYLKPWGSHPLADVLLSSEELEILHHCNDLNRHKKLVALLDWPPVWAHLRVCWADNAAGLVNCCACPACLRTMADVQALGVRERFTTFEKPLNRKLLRRMNYSPLWSNDTSSDILRAAKAARQWSLVFDIYADHWRGRVLSARDRALGWAARLYRSVFPRRNEARK